MIFGPAIEPFRRSEAPPPQGMRSFFRWALVGAWPGILWAAFWSAVAGSLEAVTATILGHVIDAANSANPDSVFVDHWMLFATFVVFYLIVRPLVYGLNTAATSVTIEPNLFPLILSRLHRWTIGQAVTFFDNDFAGRIAQKRMQTARAATDVVSGTIETVTFSLASVVGSAALLLAIDVPFLQGPVSVLIIRWRRRIAVCRRWFRRKRV